MARIQLLCFAILAYFRISVSLEVDICDVTEKQQLITPDIAQNGFVVKLSTGNTDNKQTNFDMQGNEFFFCDIDVTINETPDSGERTEISYKKAPVQSKGFCFQINFEIGGKDENDKYGCETAPTRKVFITKDLVKAIKMTLTDPLVSTEVLNFELFVENRKVDLDVDERNMVGRVEFECVHPNTFLLPNLFHDDEDVSTSLVDIKYSVFFGNNPDPAQSGEYKCSFNDISTGEAPQPRSIIKVNVYSQVIMCDVLKRATRVDESAPEWTPSGNASGSVEEVVVEGTFLTNYKMSCSLKFAGEEADPVTLRWEDPASLQSETLRPVTMNDGQTTNPEGNLKTRAFTHNIQLNTSIEYTCQVNENFQFENGLRPAPCKIKFVTKEYKKDQEDKQSQAGLSWWIYIIIAVVFVILIIVIVLIVCCCCCRKKSNKSDGVPVADSANVSVHGQDNAFIDAEVQDPTTNGNDDKIPVAKNLKLKISDVRETEVVYANTNVSKANESNNTIIGTQEEPQYAQVQDSNV